MLHRLLVPALIWIAFAAAPATAQVFSNPTPFTIPSSGAASLYPSQILVSGVAAQVTEITVTLTDLTHTWPADLDILLVGPQGQNLVLMSDAGGTTDIIDIDLVFDDAAAQALEIGAALASGSYRPANLSGTGDVFPAPAPVTSGATALSTFDGTNANGLWSLYVVDDSAGDTGSLGGWSLTVPEPGAAGQGAALVAVLALARRRSARRR